jgi:very-short-patch-repair endonuclease
MKFATTYLRAEGYGVVRFWNNDVLSNIDGVLMLLDQALRADGQTAD